jgi:2-dehydro-3-deoxygluconokinase
MSILPLRPAGECRWDLVSLGEVMLRLDPGEERIATARVFRAWEGGGEYNVARGLTRCFGLRTALVSALADNAVGRLIEDLLYQGGVDRAHLTWVPHDGVGRVVRNGLNFTERGFGVRPAVGVSDRGYTAASQMRPGDVDWQTIFGRDGARWFHTGGIFCALSTTTPEVAREAMEVARAHGAIVSYDLNYRPSLWRGQGGPSRAAEVNRTLVELADVVLGNEEDYSAALGFDGASEGGSLLELDVDDYDELLAAVLDAYPALSIATATLREARTATVNDWTAVCRTHDHFHTGPRLECLEILDRVGGGDSFASGFFYGLLSDHDVETALAYGVAHGALAMTTPGDNSMATLDDVERLMRREGARVVR